MPRVMRKFRVQLKPNKNSPCKFILWPGFGLRPDVMDRKIGIVEKSKKAQKTLAVVSLPLPLSMALVATTPSIGSTVMMMLILMLMTFGLNFQQSHMKVSFFGNLPEVCRTTDYVLHFLRSTILFGRCVDLRIICRTSGFGECAVRISSTQSIHHLLWRFCDILPLWSHHHLRQPHLPTATVTTPGGSALVAVALLRVQPYQSAPRVNDWASNFPSLLKFSGNMNSLQSNLPSLELPMSESTSLCQLDPRTDTFLYVLSGFSSFNTSCRQ